MATELQARRAEEANVRQLLEERVAEQTADLQMAVAGLQDSEARRRQLLSDISHELRTPTTVIRGEAEVALRGGDRPVAEYRDTLQRIGEAAGQLGTVIADLLTVARTDADALDVRLEPVELLGAVKQAIERTRGQASLRNVTVTFTVPHEHMMVTADPPRLAQLVGLILDNAIRYSHVGGSVTISLRHVGGRGATDEPQAAVLAIEDHGIGIAPDDLERVFDRHYRSAEARGHRPDGTGIGLAIAETLASRQGVEISVESTPKQRTVFSLRFELLAHSGPTVKNGWPTP